MSEIMREISGFNMNESMEKLIDRFEEMMLEVRSLRLAERLEYALGAQFVERLR